MAMASTEDINVGPAQPNNQILTEEERIILERVGDILSPPGQRSKSRLRTVLCPCLLKVCGILLPVVAIFGLGLGLMGWFTFPNGKSVAPSSTESGESGDQSNSDNLDDDMWLPTKIDNMPEEADKYEGAINEEDDMWLPSILDNTPEEAEKYEGFLNEERVGSDTSDTEAPADEETAALPIVEDIHREYPTAMDLVSKGIAQQIDFNRPESYQSQALQVLTFKGLAAGYSDQKLAQRYAILCLYYATNRVRTIVTDAQYGYGTTPGWHVISPWKFAWDEDECTYYGIACDADGLVTRIELASHLLTGHIPMELGLLNKGPISIFDFSGNRGLGAGGFPLVFTEFDSLAAIGLEGCRFTGSVPKGVCGKNTKITINCGLTCSCCERCLPENEE